MRALTIILIGLSADVSIQANEDTSWQAARKRLAADFPSPSTKRIALLVRNRRIVNGIVLYESEYVCRWLGKRAANNPAADPLTVSFPQEPVAAWNLIQEGDVILVSRGNGEKKKRKHVIDGKKCEHYALRLAAVTVTKFVCKTKANETLRKRVEVARKWLAANPSDEGWHLVFVVDSLQHPNKSFGSLAAILENDKLQFCTIAQPPRIFPAPSDVIYDVKVQHLNGNYVDVSDPHSIQTSSGIVLRRLNEAQAESPLSILPMP